MARRATRAERDQEDLINALMDVPERELLCRDPGIAHGWERTEDFHVIQARFHGTVLQMVARNSECHRCGKVKQERFVVGPRGVLEKIGNYYSTYEVVLHGFARGRKKSSAIWTAGYRKAMQNAASQARSGKLRAVE